MENKEFNKIKRTLNKEYFDVFGEIPCMQNFNCSREQYIDAMKAAIQGKKEISSFLEPAVKPLDKDSLI